MQEYSAQWHVPDDTNEIFLTKLDAQELIRALKRKILPEDSNTGAVIWNDGDSDVVVEVDRLRLTLKPGLIVIEMVMVADDVGEAALVVPYRIGLVPADAALLAVTEDLPRGNPVFSNRWGRIVQSILWEALQGIGREHWLAQTGNDQMVLSGIYTDGELLCYLFSSPVGAQEVADYFERPDGLDGGFDPRPVELPQPEVTGCLTAFTDWLAALGRGISALVRLVVRLLRDLGALISRWSSKSNTRKLDDK